MDFGLAKALEPAAPLRERLAVADDHDTRDDARGDVLGTAAYMAPGQATGKAADDASDILGVRGRRTRCCRDITRSPRHDGGGTDAKSCRVEPDGPRSPQRHRRPYDRCFAAVYRKTRCADCAISLMRDFRSGRYLVGRRTLLLRARPFGRQGVANTCCGGGPRGRSDRGGRHG